MSIEITMRHSDVRLEALKEYAQLRMDKLAAKFPKVTSINIVIDIDVKVEFYVFEIVVFDFTFDISCVAFSVV